MTYLQKNVKLMKRNKVDADGQSTEASRIQRGVRRSKRVARLAGALLRNVRNDISKYVTRVRFPPTLSLKKVLTKNLVKPIQCDRVIFIRARPGEQVSEKSRNNFTENALVVELAYTFDLKSNAARLVGSSPTKGTGDYNNNQMTFR